MVGNALRDGLYGGLIVVLTASGAINLVFNSGKPLFCALLPEGLRWLYAAQVGGSIIVVGQGDSVVVTAPFLADGTLDKGFNGTGYTIFENSAGSVFLRRGFGGYGGWANRGVR